MKPFLCFDPIGQGEHVQTDSRQINAPLAGWSVPEHVEMAAQTLLINQGLARYFIWDAMRSLDYLTSRPEVDDTRLGAAGGSGGGALTTFTGGLDPRNHLGPTREYDRMAALGQYARDAEARGQIAAARPVQPQDLGHMLPPCRLRLRSSGKRSPRQRAGSASGRAARASRHRHP